MLDDKFIMWKRLNKKTVVTKEVIVPGWTYLVIVISSTSLLLSLSMYSLQQSLNIIHDELCERDFEVNSYKRFY